MNFRFARLSILFSIIRIHPNQTTRQRLLYVAGLFFMTTVVLVTQLYWVCERQPGWKNEESPQCELPRQVVILQLVSKWLSASFLHWLNININSGCYIRCDSGGCPTQADSVSQRQETSSQVDSDILHLSDHYCCISCTCRVYIHPCASSLISTFCFTLTFTL